MIDKNVPLPDRVAQGSMADHYRNMEVGDSIFLPDADKRCNNMTSAAAIATKGVGKFMRRKVEGGIRMWRTA